MNMLNKIFDMLREVKFVLSIITLIIGVLIFSLSMIYWFASDFSIELINHLEGWNAYLVAIGFILILFGIYYIYTYINDKKFILKEIETKKRSEFQKVHTELKKRVKRLPKKYQTMLRKKEKELKIK